MPVNSGEHQIRVFRLTKRFSEPWRTTENTSLLTTNRKVAALSPAECTCNPSDRGCAKPHPTIHWPSTKIGIRRGLELLLEDGCLREERASGATGYARWKAQLPVALLNKKKPNHLDKKRLLELWLSNHVTPTFDTKHFSSDM